VLHGAWKGTFESDYVYLLAALIQKVPALEPPSDERRDVNASHDDPVEGYP